MIFDLLGHVEEWDVQTLMEEVIKQTGYGDMLDKEAPMTHRVKAGKIMLANSSPLPRIMLIPIRKAACRISWKTLPLSVMSMNSKAVIPRLRS